MSITDVADNAYMALIGALTKVAAGGAKVVRRAAKAEVDAAYEAAVVAYAAETRTPAKRCAAT